MPHALRPAWADEDQDENGEGDDEGDGGGVEEEDEDTDGEEVEEFFKFEHDVVPLRYLGCYGQGSLTLMALLTFTSLSTEAAVALQQSIRELTLRRLSARAVGHTLLPPPRVLHVRALEVGSTIVAA